MWLPLTHPLLGNWPTAQACALPGNGTGEPLVCRPALSPLSHTSQGCTGIMNEVERAKSESGRGKGLWQQVLPEWLPTWCQILRCDLCHTHTHTHTLSTQQPRAESWTQAALHRPILAAAKALGLFFHFPVAWYYLHRLGTVKAPTFVKHVKPCWAPSRCCCASCYHYFIL